MARDRTELQAKLLELAPKAWFKRPPDNRMSYPCFIYRPTTPSVQRADNRLYLLPTGNTSRTGCTIIPLLSTIKGGYES